MNQICFCLNCEMCLIIRNVKYVFDYFRYTLKTLAQGAGTFNINPSSGIVYLAKGWLLFGAINLQKTDCSFPVSLSSLKKKKEERKKLQNQFYCSSKTIVTTKGAEYWWITPALGVSVVSNCHWCLKRIFYLCST